MSFIVQGRVVQRAECRPISTTDQQNMRLKREALLKPVEAARKTVQLSKVVNSYKPVSNHQANIKVRMEHGTTYSLWT